MAILSALYYPHATLTDKSLIKNSLLLWDKVNYITPFVKGHHDRFESNSFNEAIEIIAEAQIPNENEKDEVHKRIVEQVRKGLPRSFLIDPRLPPVEGDDSYTIYPGKLAWKTWQFLQEECLAIFGRTSQEFHLNNYLGLIVMSILADVCAGQSKRKITDRIEAYSFVQEFITNESGGKFVVDDAAQISSEFDRLVSISLKVIDTDQIPISTLVEMRKREARSSSPDYRNFRINYLNKIDEFVDRIVKPGIRPTDIREYERQFEIEMESEYKELKSELRLAGTKSLLSKEVLVAAVALATAACDPVTGLTALSEIFSLVGIGALSKVGIEYKESRKKVLLSNSMSWLYLANNEASQFDPRRVIF